MNDAEVLVVGSGLTGLLSAVFVARQGRRVRLIHRGQGAVGIGGGTIDVLGYAPNHTGPLAAPLSGIADLSLEHPYRLAGETVVREALNAFLSLTAELGYAHHVRREGETFLNTSLLTCAGTSKPSCIVPPTMAMEGIAEGGDILVVGFEGLKDIHPRLMLEGFSRLKALAGRTILKAVLPCPPGLDASGFPIRPRDLSSIDLARQFETPEGFAWLVERLKKVRGGAHTILLPPVLGLTPSPHIHARLENALDCRVHEVLTPPPSVTGLRLRTLLQNELRRLRVDIVANAAVTGAEYADGTCTALLSSMAGRPRRWSAEQFIIATGGIYGEGLVVTPDSVTDTIFGKAVALRPDLTPSQEGWSLPEAFPSACSGQGHGFARLGVAVDAGLHPLNADGAPLCANVVYAGRAVGGYDHAAEKSGNGVALVTAFAAAKA